MHVSVDYVACKWRCAPFVLLILNISMLVTKWRNAVAAAFILIDHKLHTFTIRHISLSAPLVSHSRS